MVVPQAGGNWSMDGPAQFYRCVALGAGNGCLITMVKTGSKQRKYLSSIICLFASVSPIIKSFPCIGLPRSRAG